MTEGFLGIPLPIWTAIIGFSGSVFLGPIFTRFIARFFETKSNLIVSIAASDIVQSPFLRSLIKDDPELLALTDEWEIVRIFKSLKGCIALNIKNSGRDTIKSVTFSLDNKSHFEGVAQLGSDNTVSLFNKKSSIDFGDIQPGRSVEITIYSSMKVTDYGPDFFRKDLRISADRLDGISHKFLVPEYLGRLKTEKNQRYLTRASAAMTILALISLAVNIFIHFRQ